MEHHRKQAKALAKAVRAGEPEALARARAVLGGRDRFLLSDAQHVVARELGHRSWAELKHAEAERAEWEVDTGLRYTEAEPVLVHVKKRLHRYLLDDRGAAARLAGRPPGWAELAHELVEQGCSLNVDRRGRIFVPSVHPHTHEELIRRIGDASLALYLALLDLDE